MNKQPVFRSISGSTQIPGVMGTIFQGRRVSAYTVFTVTPNMLFVMEHVSAAVYRGPIPYPPENSNDFGAVGFKIGTQEHFHFVPFFRSEPDGMLVTSQSLRLHIPENAQVIVKVPLIPNQSGGASVQVSGYYIPSANGLVLA